MSSTKLLTTVTRQLHVRSPPTLKSCLHHHRRSVHKLASLPEAFQFIKISPEIQAALQRGAPVVALESANITCPAEVGALPLPLNSEFATKVEREIRKMGAIPATMMVLAGRVHVGIEDPALYYEMGQRAAMKVSQRELPFVLGMPGRRSGGLTVSAALTIASMIGIKVLATGAIGGVHRSATTLMDISADVNELGRRNVAVVCSGPKVYLDAEGTIEYLETKGVPVATFGKGTMEVKLPAHYSTEGELQSPLVLKNAKEAARMIHTSHECGLETGQLLCNPIPYQNQLNLEIVERSVKKYFKERKKHSKKDKEVVENMVSTIRRFNNTDRTVAAEKVMLMHNAQMAAKVAIELARIETGIDWRSKDRTETTKDREDYRPGSSPDRDLENGPNHSAIYHDKQTRQVYVPGKGYLHPISTMRDSGQQLDEQQQKKKQQKQQQVRPVIRRSLSRDPLSDYEISRRQPFQRSDQSSEEPRNVLAEWPLPEPVPRTQVVTERGFTIRRGAHLGVRV
ncbi:uncharacterized protein H6S33_008537 [Morchella sextelata]|uniref:uncharacterized protein n=1 Tax=Morchella sextelata TaxID=1174677 RepID=UPI001D03AC0D|nr:uncharacterized protein H6S33_008537 [Morchella sextelata]KAH0602887.1 hypothetical protein H6S33_008537 [Morchella sextelata]